MSEVCQVRTEMRNNWRTLSGTGFRPHTWHEVRADHVAEATEQILHNAVREHIRIRDNEQPRLDRGVLTEGRLTAWQRDAAEVLDVFVRGRHLVTAGNVAACSSSAASAYPDLLEHRRSLMTDIRMCSVMVSYSVMDSNG